MLRPGQRVWYLVGEATHEHTVACQLTHVAGTELPHLGGDAVLLHQRFLHRPGTLRQVHQTLPPGPSLPKGLATGMLHSTSRGQRQP